MRLKKLRLQRSTCYGMGLVSAAFLLIGGILMILGYGRANYAHMASFIMNGAMLLFFAVCEKGPEKKGLRAKLLLLFFMLLVAYLRLPPLDWLEVPVLPLLAMMFRKKGDSTWMAGLLVAEAGYALLRSLALLSTVLGPNALLYEGIGAAVLALVRGVVVFRLRRRALIDQNRQDDDAVRKLR